MKRHKLGFCAAILLGAAAAGGAAAQNVVITNARIIDGAGRIIERGSIVAQDGKIVSVQEGAATAPRGAQRVDAQGMTVLPAFIDAHRHLIRGEAQAWLKDQAAPRMREFVEAGFTTVFSMGDDPAILELRRRLSAGEIAGPRLFAARVILLARPVPAPAPAGPPPQFRDPGRTDPARPPNRPTSAPPAIPDEESRASVQAAKQQGYDAIKTILIATPGGPEAHTLSVIADEARKQGLRTYTHATSVQDALTAVNSKTDVLAHTPHIGQLEENEAARQTILKSGLPMVSTLGVFIPHFEKDNQPLYRDGGPFPMPRPLSSAGQGPVNARLLWDGGLTYAYGTDTQWNPRVSLGDELRALSLVFSPTDILKIMGPNSAAAIGKSAELGTLQPGKRADIVIVDGDPLDDIFKLTKVAVVVMDGKVIVDKRASARRR
jgi:imidazolonepropionase-like amidohydrolase